MVGALIAARRRALGLSQSQLAEATGLNQTYISRVERGEVEVPQRATLEKFGQALGVGLPEFYRAAGMLDNLPEEPPPAPGLPVDGARLPQEERLDLARIVAYVESKPGQTFQQRLARLKAALPREDYERICAKIFGAWTSNEDLGLSLGEMLVRD